MCRLFWSAWISYTEINIFEILLNQTEIRLYLPLSDWLGTKRNIRIFHSPIDLEPNGRPFAVTNQSENGKYKLISVWFDEIPKKKFTAPVGTLMRGPKNKCEFEFMTRVMGVMAVQAKLPLTWPISIATNYTNLFPTNHQQINVLKRHSVGEEVFWAFLDHHRALSIVLRGLRRFKDPHDAERRQSLGQRRKILLQSGDHSGVGGGG